MILAQIGCFVPAEYMSFSPCDYIFTRMGNLDNIETNSSSFMVEMQETAYLLKNATNKSLVLIDELGNSTGTTDGEAIAWTTCEHLIELKAFSIVTTHFGNLPNIQKFYPNCT